LQTLWENAEDKTVELLHQILQLLNHTGLHFKFIAYNKESLPIPSQDVPLFLDGLNDRQNQIVKACCLEPETITPKLLWELNRTYTGEITRIKNNIPEKNILLFIKNGFVLKMLQDCPQLIEKGEYSRGSRFITYFFDLTPEKWEKLIITLELNELEFLIYDSQYDHKKYLFDHWDNLDPEEKTPDYFYAILRLLNDVYLQCKFIAREKKSVALDLTQSIPFHKFLLQEKNTRENKKAILDTFFDVPLEQRQTSSIPQGYLSDWNTAQPFINYAPEVEEIVSDSPDNSGSDAPVVPEESPFDLDAFDPYTFLDDDNYDYIFPVQSGGDNTFSFDLDVPPSHEEVIEIDSPSPEEQLDQPQTLSTQPPFQFQHTFTPQNLPLTFLPPPTSERKPLPKLTRKPPEKK
jgi:hypothetical protein